MKILLILTLIMLSSFLFSDPLTLVSDNTIDFPGDSKVFSANTPFIKTGAEVILVDADDETTSTFNNSIASVSKGISNGKCAWTDGSFLAGFGIEGNIQDQTWSKWGGGKATTVIFDLKKEYPIAQIDIYSLCSASLYTEKVEVELSSDGEKYYPRGTTPNVEERGDKVSLSKISPIIMPPINARFVKLIIHPTQMWQQQIGEIAIWADIDTKNTGSLTIEPVAFNARPMGFGAIYFDINDFKALNMPVKNYTVYYSEKEFTDISQATKFNTFEPNVKGLYLYPLTPGKTYFVTVTATYETGENKEINIQKITVPKNYVAKTFNDMLAINHYPGGGGAHVNREFESSWDIVSMELLSELPVKEHRWWFANEDWIKRFYERGISLFKESGYSEDKSFYDHKKYGIYNICHGNEPEYSKKPIDDFNDLKNMYDMVKSVDPNFIVCAPVAGTEASSLEWVDEWYSYGAKDYFDCYDVHPYTKIGGHENLEGCPAGSPEQLLLDIPKLRDIMKKYGDENKPIIASEWGYSTIGYNNVSGKLNPQMQAEYLTRGLILHNVLGLARVYIYAFFDEGQDPYNTEHHFGIVDYMGQKKPAFYAIKNLCDKIGNMSYKQEVKGTGTPVFGYTFANEDETASVIWNAQKPQKATFKTNSDTVTITDMLGNNTKTIKVIDGKFTSEISPSLIIIKHKEPIEIIEFAEVPIIDDTIQIFLDKDTLYTKENEKISLKINIENRYNETVKGNITLLDNSINIAQKTWNLDKGKKSDIILDWVNNNKDCDLRKLTLKITYEAKDQTSDILNYLWVRNVSSSTDLYSKDFEGYSIIGNDKIEMLISYEFGGRLCDLIDKETLTNQVRMDYNELKRLDQLFWNYTIWDEINCYDNEWKSYFKNTPLNKDIVIDNDVLKLNLKTSNNVLDYEKNYILSKGESFYENEFVLKNKTNKDIKIKYSSHPEWTIGGSAESSTDVMIFNTEDGETTLPIKLAQGEINHKPINMPYVLIKDTQNNITLRQDFSLDFIHDISIWFGESFYNTGFMGKEINLTPSESIKGTIKFALG